MLSEIASFKLDTCPLGTHQYTQWIDCDSLINTVTLSKDWGNEFEAVNLSTACPHTATTLSNGFVWFNELNAAYALAVARLLSQKGALGI
jgi:hypothetical protein